MLNLPGVAVVLLALLLAGAGGGKLGNLASARPGVAAALPLSWRNETRVTTGLTGVLAVFEGISAIWLISGWRASVALTSVLLMLSAFTLFLIVRYLGNTEAGCNCFGDVLPKSWATARVAIVRNAGLIVLVIVAMVEQPKVGSERLWIILMGIVATSAYLMARRSRAASRSRKAEASTFSGRQWERLEQYLVNPVTTRGLVTVVIDERGWHFETCSAVESTDLFECAMVSLPKDDHGGWRRVQHKH